MGRYDIAGIAKNDSFAWFIVIENAIREIERLISQSFKVWTESRQDIELYLVISL